MMPRKAADYIQGYGDKQGDKLARKIESIYREAARDIREKLSAFEEKHKAKNAQMLQKLKDGSITEQEYRRWMSGQVFIGKQWKEKLDDITKTYMHADEQARAMLSGTAKDVFAEAANYTAYDIDGHFKLAGDFTLYDKNTVGRLMRGEKKLLPEWKIDEPKDYRWNATRVQNAITQGILQGESVQQIGKRLTSELAAKNAGQMEMFARTAITSAQNAGRMEMLHNAQNMGIKVKKKWLATLDSRTRDAHAELDGQVVDVDEPFQSSLGPIMCPGDMSADPANVYNCRCTMIYVYPEYDKESASETSGSAQNMSYAEWKDLY